MITLTHTEMRLIMLALNLTSNIPANGSDVIRRQNEEMRELYNRLDDMTETADYKRPLLFTVKQQ